MRTLKINFVDFWQNFDYKSFFLYKYLSSRYKLILSEDPDYLICSSFGYKHWRYKNCIKIYFTGENLFPDFNIYDYGIGFYYLSLDDRYLRFPLWLLYSWDRLDAMEKNSQITDSSLSKRKFCNFVYSNSVAALPIRERFYHELSKYKKIDSGGSFLNNIGYRVPDKLAFIKDYKFTIGIENSAVAGYTTEKIIEPMMVNSVPIYYGDPLISNDFNMRSCVHLRDYKDFNDAIEAIISLDKDDALYMAKLNEHWFSYENIKQRYDNAIDHFFTNIFEKDKQDAVRISNYGFACRYRKEMIRTQPWSTTMLIEKGYGLKDRIEKLWTKK